MAISSIISFGFGNGTFDPGVNKLPTLGYSIGEAIEAPIGLTSITRRVRLTDIDTRVLYIVDHVHKVRV